MLGTLVKPDWEREGRDWPNRGSSRFIQAAGLRWHVQTMGQGPPLLLLHGSGAATHSWRDVAPRLASEFSVIAPDLPGHGFTQTPTADGLSLTAMAAAVSGLLRALDVRPAFVVGHSAGAAIAIRMRLDGHLDGAGLISLNGALRPFPGASGHIFPMMAKLLFLNPLAVQMFAWRAGAPGAVAQLIEGTGSRIGPEGVELYTRLLRTTGHIAGALGMMAHWDLNPLVTDLPRLPPGLALMAAENDRAVPPQVAREVKAQVPDSRLAILPGLGHLAHEEAPERIVDFIRRATLGGLV